MDHWKITRAQLRYCIGEFCLYVSRFSALVTTRHFLELRDTHIDPDQLFQSVPDDVRAIYLSSWPTDASLKRLSFHPRYYTYVQARFPRYFISISSTFDEYLKHNFSSKPRHNLLRSLRRFSEFCGGHIDFRKYSDPTEVGQFYDLARQISQLTYQDRLLQVGFPASPSFRDELAKSALDGRVAGFVLFCNGKPIAFAFCTIYASIIIYNIIGFDPAYSQWSPGTVLLYLILKHIFDEGRFSTFDFGGGEAHYKSFFANSSVPCANIYYFRRNIVSLATLMSHSALQACSDHIASIFQHLRIKKKVKKFFRTHL